VVYPNADVVTYAYNNAGDRVSEQLNEKPSVVYEYDAAGRMLSKGDEIFSYDADGNMLNDAVATYTWNSDNRLVRVEKASGDCKHKKDRRGHGFGHLKHAKEAVVYEEYAYLPQDWRRITRKTGINRRGDSRIARAEQTFVSIYDGADESHEYLLRKSKFKFRGKRHSRRESLKLFREFVGGPATDDIKHTRYKRLSLAMLKDGLGSTIALTGKEARPIARINYDAWGEFRYEDKLDKAPCKNEKFDDYLERLEGTRGFGRGNHNARAFGKHFGSKLTPYLYTGRKYSKFTQQYFNRNRYYSPALGRFTSKDPIGFNGDINLYRYAANNPVIYTDPTGKVPQIIVFTLIAQELLALKITYDFYSTNLFPVCDKLCPGERAYVSGLTPPFSGAKIIVYKPKTDECGTDIFVEQGLLPFGDCAYGFAGYYGY
jgi:RHS repeat-associated protein